MHKNLSPFSHILFAYLTLQYKISGFVNLTMIVKYTQQLLLRIAIGAGVIRITMMTPSPLSLYICVCLCARARVRLATTTPHNPKYSTSSITKGSWFSCNFDMKSSILIILFFIFCLNM